MGTDGFRLSSPSVAKIGELLLGRDMIPRPIPTIYCRNLCVVLSRRSAWLTFDGPTIRPAAWPSTSSRLLCGENDVLLRV
jgi:hypothetical protein